jgi:hypothetical protein
MTCRDLGPELFEEGRSRVNKGILEVILGGVCAVTGVALVGADPEITRTIEVINDAVGYVSLIGGVIAVADGLRRIHQTSKIIFDYTQDLYGRTVKKEE